MISDREIIAEAVSDWRKKETFEHTLGRVVKRRGGDFEDYIRIVGQVREVARRKKSELIEAAREMAESDDKKENR